MNKKHINLLSLAILIIALSFNNAFSQIGSPYSQFGIGNIKSGGLGSGRSMGGFGIGWQTNEHINIINPASLSSLDSLTVIYELGLSGGFNKIESKFDNTTKTGSNIDYLALGFKVNRIYATSFGVLPASKVDYLFKSNYNDNVVGNIDQYFYGSGGLNSVYWANSFNINENLTLGIEAKYLFGAINNIKTIVFTDDVTIHNTKIDEKKNINGFKFKYGLQYKFDLKKDINIIVGAVYENKISVKAKVDTLAGLSQNAGLATDASYYRNVYYNELLPSSIYASSTKDNITLPSSYGFGFTINKAKVFTFGTDFEFQNWSSLSKSDFGQSFENRLSIRSGLQILPDINNVNHYYKRVRYRIGGHYTKSHIKVNNTGIKDYGISFGVGLPLRNTKTSFNITCELGQRGTLDENLLKETYGVISLNLSLSDIWFVKRKFK